MRLDKGVYIARPLDGLVGTKATGFLQLSNEDDSSKVFQYAITENLKIDGARITAVLPQIDPRVLHKVSSKSSVHYKVILSFLIDFLCFSNSIPQPKVWILYFFQASVFFFLRLAKNKVLPSIIFKSGKKNKRDAKTFFF